jgi:hypothetical protein
MGLRERISEARERRAERMESNVEAQKIKERTRIERLEKKAELETLKERRRRLEVRTGSGVRGTIAKVERGRKKVSRTIGSSARGFEPLPISKKKRFVKKKGRKRKRSQKPKVNQFNKDRAALRSIGINI